MQLHVKIMRSVAVISVLVALVCVISACSDNKVPGKLSELDDDLLIWLLAEDEIIIPDNIETSVIRSIIADLEVEPDKPAPIVGWTEFIDFYKQLRNFVKEYNKVAP